MHCLAVRGGSADGVRQGSRISSILILFCAPCGAFPTDVVPMTNSDPFDRLVQRLQSALAGPLPGSAAQSLLAPRPRRGWQPGTAPVDCRQAAALLLVYPRAGAAHVLLTLRRADLKAHAGQVSLPGGALDNGETHEQASLREAWEEVGLEPSTVQVLGRLTPLHIPASGFNLQPVVGVTAPLPALRPADEEVERILETPLARLAASDTLEVEDWDIRGTEAIVPFFHLHGLKIWGATAMVLAEFLTLLGSPPDPWGDATASPPEVVP